MKKIVLLLMIVAAAASTHAQNRYADVSSEMRSPLDGALIKPQTPVKTKYTIKNNGPDAIKVGDTLIGGIMLDGNIVTPSLFILVAQKDILNGDSLPITFIDLIWSGEAKSGLQYCCSTFVIKGPASDSLFDNVPSNNLGCSSVEFLTNVGIDIPTISFGQNGVSCFPNPANNTVQFAYELNSNDQVQLTIYDMEGRQVATVVNEKKSMGLNIEQFDASQLTSGLYIYKLSTATNSVSGRMSIAH
jgi:hypothetical protein